MASASDYSELIAGGTSVGTGNIIVMVLALVAIVFAAYYVTRFITGRAIRMMRSQKMHIVDRMAIAHDKQIMILQIGDEAHLIGVTGSQITELARLNPEILAESEAEAHAARVAGAGQGDTFFGRFMSAMKANISEKMSARRPRSAYERAKSEYERTLQEQRTDTPPASQKRKGDNIDDMSEMARRRNGRYGKPGDDE